MRPRDSVAAGEAPDAQIRLTESQVVSQVDWHAAGPDTAVKPAEYQEFRIAAGALPETDHLVFKVAQTYDDGQVVRWIDEPAAGGAELDQPAPVLNLGVAPPPARISESLRPRHRGTSPRPSRPGSRRPSPCRP